MLAIDKKGCEKLFRFVYEVKKQPCLFLKEKSVVQLGVLTQGFICGYNSACDYGLKEFHEATKGGNIWSDFQAFFGEKYNTSYIYHLEVVELCGSEEKAFDLFFEEMESYLTEHTIEILKGNDLVLAWQEEQDLFLIDKPGRHELLRIAFEIKKRPPLFFREKSFTKLILYLQGFIHGYKNYKRNIESVDGCEYSNEGVDKETIWSGFQKYFQEKYSTTSIYHTEVLEHCGSEEAAFDLFFEELEQYLTEHGVEIPKVR